jgi:hypothetical protein
LDNCEIAIHDFRMRKASERGAKCVRKFEEGVENVPKKRNLSKKVQGVLDFMEIGELKIMK